MEVSMQSPKKKSPRRSNMPLLLGALLLLVLAALLVADPFHWLRPTDEKIAEKDPERRVLVDMKADELTALEIRQPDQDRPFRLEKDKDRWYVVVDGKRTKADSERIDKIIEELPGLRADSIATSDQTSYDDMEVSDGKAIMLKVYKGGTTPAASLHVGKAAPGFQTSFVRLDGGKEVWRAGKNVKSLFGYTAEDYRTKKPWAFKTEAATKVSLQKFIAAAEDEKTRTTPPPLADAPRMTFELAEGLWKRNGANANQNAIKEFLNSLKDLQINEYVPESGLASAKLDNRQPSVEVESPEGTFSIALGGKDSTYFYVKDQDGNVYKASEYNLNFYREIDWDKLSFDDTPKQEPKEEANADLKDEKPEATK
ncbi:MAG: DUF4340 domain-containing protein [bacterium]|nr:DUF4340 domain-containing protein [bacterium]